MRRLSLAAVVVLFFIPFAAYADQVDYTVTGWYSSDVPVTRIVTPNLPYKMQFSIATPVQNPFVFSQGFEVDASLLYQSGQINEVFDAYIVFYYDWVGGLFNVNLYDGNDSYAFSLTGAQAFTGDPHNPTLLLGAFPFDAAFLYYNDDVTINGAYPGVAYATSVPEPATLGMLGAAVGLLGAARCRLLSRL